MRVLCLLLLGFGFSAEALAGPGWERLGTREVKIRGERDTIPVTVKDGRFSKLKLKVLKNGVRFMDLKVHFGNGEVHDVAIRNLIPAGGETRVIDLPGRKRVIKKVVFTYRTDKMGRRAARATVLLFGKH